MLKNLVLAAAIAAFAFALSFVGLSGWRSFYDQNHQTNQESRNENPAEERGNAAQGISAKQSTDEALARYTLWLTVFTGFLALVGFFQIGFLISADEIAAKTAQASKDSSDAFRAQLILAYPPHIIIPLIKAAPKDRPGQPIALSKGNEITGIVRAINHGREVAEIVREACMAYWRVGNLPMVRPFDPEAEPGPKCGPVHDEAGNPVTMLEPGGEATWSFETKVPDAYSSDMILYITGYVRYKDRLNFNQYVVFTRRYDPGLGRFVPVENNTAYEYEN